MTLSNSKSTLSNPPQSGLTIGLMLLASSVFVACSDSNSQTLLSNTAMELQGARERSGYGLPLNVDGDALTVFDATRASCYLRDAEATVEFMGEFPIVVIDEDQLQRYQWRADIQSHYLGAPFETLDGNPVILITSGFSVSATEAFTVLIRSLPQVMHIGEPTNGALSDVLGKELPNGWEFTLSKEVC